MKAVLISIQPKWCELIANGKKTVEVRKTKPKLETPFKVYIYCTKGETVYLPRDIFGNEPLNGKVIGEFVCDKVERIAHCGTCNSDIRLRIVDENFYCKELDYEYLNKCKLSYSDIDEYSNGGDVHGWHISKLEIYDTPKELSEFFVYCDRCDKRPIDCKFAYEECNENGYYSECMCDFKRPIEKPPQSWCYVERLGEG